MRCLLLQIVVLNVVAMTGWAVPTANQMVEFLEQYNKVRAISSLVLSELCSTSIRIGHILESLTLQGRSTTAH